MEGKPAQQLSYPPLPLAHVLQEAWHLLKGSKGPIWAIAILMIIATTLVTIILINLFQFPDMVFPAYYQFLLAPLINSLVIAPFLGGAIMVAIKRARHEPVTFKTGYGYFRKTGAVMITLLLITFLANIINYIVHLPALVLLLGLHIGWLEILSKLITILVYTFGLFAIALVVDQNRKPIDALLQSCRIIKTHWLKVLVCIILIYLIFFVTLIPYVVGSLLHVYYTEFLGFLIFAILEIWCLPFFFLLVGVLYHHMVDSIVETSAPSSTTSSPFNPNAKTQE